MTVIPTIDLVDALAAEYADKSPREILELALSQQGEIAISFSGAEDVVLIDIASRLGKPFRVFSLDTGRLHAETYQFIETVRKHYNINIEICFPESAAVQQLVNEKGLFSFFEDGHQECCGVRKVQPLRKKLATLDGWITGQRKDQSPTRSDVPVIQADVGFSGEGKQLIKYNPLANWSSADVWSYIRMMEIPYNPHCMSVVLSRLVVNRVLALYCQTNMNVTAAGGGKRQPIRNVACMRAILKNKP